jgi:Peptidase A4 family
VDRHVQSRRLILVGLILLLAPIIYLLGQPITPAGVVSATEGLVRSPLPVEPAASASASAAATRTPVPTATAPRVSATPPPPASGPTGLTSSTTDPSVAGYIVSGSSFTSVRGTWQIPSITCGSVQDHSVAVWIGTEGVSGGASAQVGTSTLCVRGALQTFAWYQAAPAAAVRLSVAVAPGQTVSGAVTSSGTTFTFSLIDESSGARATATATLAGAPRDAAAWFVDRRPIGCRGTCTGYTLGDFGRIELSGAQATGSGRSGAIDEAAWSEARVSMVTNGTTQAEASTLGSSGSAFTVTWLKP